MSSIVNKSVNLRKLTPNQRKKMYYEDKRDLKQEMVNRVLDGCIDDSTIKHSEGLMLALKTLMPNETKRVAEQKADEMVKKYEFQKERETNNNFKMFAGGDIPVHDMLYLLTYGNSVRKFSAKKIEQYNNDEFIELAENYLEYCEKRKIQPNVPGLATWCGISTSKLTKMNNGSIECACLDGVQMVMSLFQSMDEELAATFKTNGAVHIFNSKNYYGMKDKQTNEINVNDNDLTKRQKIIDAIPVEYTEVKVKD